ncbi:hypothetical protein JHK85_054132 [Glycine max]|nr:hypothetical protein JHK85_054132 [Glycine max]
MAVVVLYAQRGVNSPSGRSGGKRSDGRTPDGIRPIYSRCGLLPRAHGSTLFTRGETQALAVVTLGDKQMAQRIDSLDGVDEFKRFYLQVAKQKRGMSEHEVGTQEEQMARQSMAVDRDDQTCKEGGEQIYSFPPSCVGEVGRIGAPSRREIGHGMLAERSLEPILPSEDDFPYTIRVESTITESNGSSSKYSWISTNIEKIHQYPLNGYLCGCARTGWIIIWQVAAWLLFVEVA